MLLAHSPFASFRLSLRRVAAVSACLGMGLGGFSLQAADRTLSSLVQKELARRNTLMQEARALITEGGLLYTKGELEQAASTYRAAWDLLPDSPMTAQLRLEARNGYSRTAVALAEKWAGTGRYADAKALLNSVLADDFDPQNEDAKELLVRLDDPDRYEPALTPQHVQRVALVEKELRLGMGFISLGDYNSAIARFQEALRYDPYNTAARRGMERAEQLKSEYYNVARDHTRAKKLAEVDATWEDTVPAVDLSGLFGGEKVGVIGGGRENLLTRMRTLIIPRVELQGASLAEVVEYLRIRARDVDPQKRGLDFVLRVSPESAAMPVTLTMVNVPIEEVLRYATEMTNTVYRADEFAITITSRAEKSTTLISRSYRVPPDFIQNAPAGAAPGAATPPDPFATPAPGTGTGFIGLQIRRLSAREFLEQRGITFPDGATAAYTPSTSVLMVRNTAENLALVDTLVEQAASTTPKQVEIQVKLIEVNQNRFTELGFDWMMSAFNVPGSERVFASGGTRGNQGAAPDAFDMSFRNPVTPATAVGVNPITAGLRSSGALLGTPSIDQLIGRVSTVASDSRSPGTFAVSGVFTDPQFQVVMRSLSQSKGIDLLASPTVVTKSGQRASIIISREFIYPTEFDPPQVPQDTATLVTFIDPVTGAIIGSDLIQAEVVPVTPATPTTFEKRDVGITLEVEAAVGADNRTIDLNLVPSSTEFEGFIDYGTPIFLSGAAIPAGTIVATENHILQPIFRSNKITTSVTVWDGSTVVLGGVMYQKRQDIDDKVPILGDIPIIGRTFQSKVKQVEMKNVIFFVTARVVDPSGRPFNQTIVPTATAAAQ